MYKVARLLSSTPGNRDLDTLGIYYMCTGVQFVELSLTLIFACQAVLLPSSVLFEGR